MNYIWNLGLAKLLFIAIAILLIDFVLQNTFLLFVANMFIVAASLRGIWELLSDRTLSAGKWIGMASNFYMSTGVLVSFTIMFFRHKNFTNSFHQLFHSEIGDLIVIQLLLMLFNLILYAVGNLEKRIIKFKFSRFNFLDRKIHIWIWVYIGLAVFYLSIGYLGQSGNITSYKGSTLLLNFYLSFFPGIAIVSFQYIYRTIKKHTAYKIFFFLILFILIVLLGRRLLVYTLLISVMLIIESIEVFKRKKILLRIFISLIPVVLIVFVGFEASRRFMQLSGVQNRSIMNIVDSFENAEIDKEKIYIIETIEYRALNTTGWLQLHNQINYWDYSKSLKGEDFAHRIVKVIPNQFYNTIDLNTGESLYRQKNFNLKRDIPNNLALSSIMDLGLLGYLLYPIFVLFVSLLIQKVVGIYDDGLLKNILYFSTVLVFLNMAEGNITHLSVFLRNIVFFSILLFILGKLFKFISGR